MDAPHPSYAEALDWLFARTREGRPRDPAHMRALMAALELHDPPYALHVGGTNGKGTVSVMLAAGLTAAGVRTGRFLSPHVEDFRERVAIDGVEVSRWKVRRYVADAMALERCAPDVLPVAFFEHTLALALRSFREAGVGAAVLEAGVGGALDATRAVEGVRLVVITNVSLDHVATLGPTIADIARAKAGAIRAEVPVVTGATGVALEVIRATARRLGARVYSDEAGDPLFDPPPEALPAPTMDRGHGAQASPEIGAPARSRVAAHGSTQVGLGTHATTRAGAARLRNARLAAAALRVLGHDETSVRAAVTAPALPARLERFPLGSKVVILDGAHDPAAGALLADDLDGGYVLLFGALARKLGDATLATLEPKAREVVITEARPGEAPLASLGGRRLVADPLEALQVALGLTPAGGALVIAGSLYLAGSLRPRLRALVEAPSVSRADRAVPG